MPIIVISRAIRKRGRRGQHFDAAVTRLAPAIDQARKQGYLTEEAIMNCLNETGVPAPTGRRFTAGSIHRVLTRLEELGLGPGPRPASVAAWTRPSRAGVGAARRSAARQSPLRT